MSVLEMPARDPRQLGMALRRTRRALRVSGRGEQGQRHAGNRFPARGWGEGVKLKTVTDVMAALGVEFVLRPRLVTAATDDVADLF